MVTTRVCPHCNAYSHFTEAWSDQFAGSSAIEVRDKHLNRFLDVCDNCGGVVCGTHQMQTGDTHLWPIVVHRKDYPDVPEAIAAAASEAHQALGAEAPRACAAMARATIEATAKNQRVTGRNLEEKINKLAAAGLISDTTRDAAHEIRFAGNEAAHGDIVDEPISLEEAAAIAELMDAILHRVYQEPAKVARIRASREARTNRQEPTQAVG
jgi:hypothetical protein